MKRYINLVAGLLLLLAGCSAIPNEDNTSSTSSISDIQITNIKDIVPITKELVDNGTITLKSFIVNTTNGERINTDSLFEEVPNFFTLFGNKTYDSNYQYYTDQLVVGCQSCGGTSYVYRTDNDQHLVIDTVNYNIVYYDEDKKTYLAQTQEGYVLLDNNYQVKDQYPVLSDNNINADDDVFQLKAYGLDEIYYVGKYGGKPYQIMKYDINSKQLKLVYDLIEALNAQGIAIDGNAEFNPAITYYKNQGEAYLMLLLNKAWNGKDDFVLINKIVMINSNDDSISFEDAYDETDVAYPQLDFSYNVMQSSDMISLFKLENKQIIRFKEYYAEDIINDEDNHINYIYRIDENEIIMNVPSGVMKYDIQSNTSTQLYVDRVED